MIPHEDAELVTRIIDPLEESPLARLDLKEEFKSLDYLTCRVCNEDVTLKTCYFEDSGTPYCEYCYNFILDRDEDEDEDEKE